MAFREKSWRMGLLRIQMKYWKRFCGKYCPTNKNMVEGFLFLWQGGVYDGKDMARLITEGASGVQIATRFIATEECDASDTYKQMMVNAKEEDITLVKSPVGLPGRALRTPMIKRLEEGIKLSPERCNLCLKACPHGSETPYCISRALIEAVKGNVEDGLFFCGANVGRINKIVTVKALMQELMQDYETEMKGILAERGVV